VGQEDIKNSISLNLNIQVFLFFYLSLDLDRKFLYNQPIKKKYGTEIY
jgi:hypothetical protein